MPVLLAITACQTVGGQKPTPKRSPCAPDREWTEAFAAAVRTVFDPANGADSSTARRPEVIVPVYDPAVCARAIQVYLEDDAPPDSRRHAPLTARVLSVGEREWAAIILPDECTYHWFDRAWHHIGVHLWACL